MCTRNSGQSRRKRRICSRRQVCSAELRLMTMEEGTAVLESYTVVRTSGVANQDGRCLSVPSVRPMSWFDLAWARGCQEGMAWYALKARCGGEASVMKALRPIVIRSCDQT